MVSRSWFRTSAGNRAFDNREKHGVIGKKSHSNNLFRFDILKLNNVGNKLDSDTGGWGRHTYMPFPRQNGKYNQVKIYMLFKNCL